MKRINKINLETIETPSFEETIRKIRKVVGKRPPLPQDLPRGNWSEQANKVLKERYLLRDEKGKVVETPEEMCWRVAWEVASAEAVWGMKKKTIVDTTREFYGLLVKREFLPNSPTLMNAGTQNKLQYSGCFVVPVDDSLVGIFDAVKYQALIHQTGGGTGFSFSRLRPRGSIVKSSRGVASGPVSFMRIFDAATNEIKQGGKRRGANMGILRIDHPDIMEFIHCKEKGGITNFNISVAITDKFMQAYKDKKKYDLIDPKTKKKAGSLEAVKVFDEIVKIAWETGDPGLVFIDRINKSSSNPVPSLGPIESTNPCGEQPLYPFDSCNLGSLFLSFFVREDKGKKVVDWAGIKKTVRLAIRFLDNVIEVNPYTLEQIRKMTQAIRRVGLGVGGWADMLLELGIPYDSDEAIILAKKVMQTIQTEAQSATVSLAKERGPFPLWPLSIYKNKEIRRNASITTIAPTGSISIIAGASSGIEPLFAIAYRHIVKDKHLNRRMSFVNPFFLKVAKKEDFWSEQLEKQVLSEGCIRHFDTVPKRFKAIFGTAHEIDYIWHIRTQEAFQKYTECAVSKTINLKKEATIADVKKAYLSAWVLNCKGITVFRDGCKEEQVLNTGLDQKESVLISKEPILNRPFRVVGATYRLSTPVGTAFITINEDQTGQPLELFVNVGKAGSDITAIAEALGRTISTALRFKGHLQPKDRAKEIAYQLAGIGGRRSVGFGPNKIRSLPDAVAVALSTHFNFNINGKSLSLENTSPLNGEINLTTNGHLQVPNLHQEKAEADVVAGSLGKNRLLYDLESDTDPASAPALPVQEKEDGGFFLKSPKADAPADICPSCGASALVYEEGCSKCHACGHSEC